MATVTLPFGNTSLSFSIDDSRLGDVITPLSVQPKDDPVQIVAAALKNPIGSPLLRDLLSPGKTVAVVIDDNTRETPGRIILPFVLEEATLAGVRREDISIVMALGAHRPMTGAEIAAKIGPETAGRYQVVNTPASHTERMVYRGRSSEGVPIWVNRAVAEADVRIGIGSIVPHLDAGWGGGAKIILPGVCGEETVDAFHEKMADIQDNQLGLPDAALRVDLEKFVGEAIGLEFIINAVLDGDGRLVGCTAGHFLDAHRAGVDLARRVYGVAVRRRYPLVIAGAHPHHIDLWQGAKALAAGDLITAEGGALILAAECREGLGPHPLFADYLACDEERLLKDFKDGRVADRLAAVEALGVVRMKKRLRIGLVSSGLTAGDAGKMGMSWYNTIEEAVRTEAAVGKTPRAAVLTHGGATLPLLTDDL